MSACCFALVVVVCSVVTSSSDVSSQPPPAEDLRLVVVVTRHGVRSPTDPAELTPYVAYPMATWEVAPGELTPNGATMMRHFGASYRAFYGDAGLFSPRGCPPASDVFVWADVDQRTRATGAALLEGFAPGCGLVSRTADMATDPLFHALPALGKADAELAIDSVAGAAGNDPLALVRAHALAFTKLDAILGCEHASCTPVSHVPSAVTSSSKTGLATVDGAVGLASTAVEDLILAYADGKPLSDVGHGMIDRETLLQLSELHTLKFALDTEPPYAARVQGSNLLSHVVETLNRRSSRIPASARFVAFIGHDTNIEALAGMLHVQWLMDGYQRNDTPPGGALVFELHGSSSASATPYVRVFFEAQSLDQMRELASAMPARVPVFVPGCPRMDCPLPVFDAVTKDAIDPAFTSAW